MCDVYFRGWFDASWFPSNFDKSCIRKVCSMLNYQDCQDVDKVVGCHSIRRWMSYGNRIMMCGMWSVFDCTSGDEGDNLLGSKDVVDLDSVTTTREMPIDEDIQRIEQYSVWNMLIRASTRCSNWYIQIPEFKWPDVVWQISTNIVKRLQPSFCQFDCWFCFWWYSLIIFSNISILHTYTK